MKYKTSNDYYMRINNVYQAVLVVPLIGFGIVYLNHEHGKMPVLVSGYWANLAIMPVVVVAATLLVYRANKAYKAHKAMGRAAATLREKLGTIMAGTDRYVALLSLAAAAIVVGYAATATKLYVVMYVVVLVLQSMNRPTLRKICDDLRLSGEERETVLRKRALEV